MSYVLGEMSLAQEHPTWTAAQVHAAAQKKYEDLPPSTTANTGGVIAGVSVVTLYILMAVAVLWYIRRSQ